MSKVIGQPPTSAMEAHLHLSIAELSQQLADSNAVIGELRRKMERQEQQGIWHINTSQTLIGEK